MGWKQRILVLAGLLLYTMIGVQGWATQRRGSSSPSLPPGTRVQFRINQALSSETARPGDTFHGSLDAPVVVNGQVLYPKGASVTGQVRSVSRSGRLSRPGVLELTLTSVNSAPLSTEPFYIKGASHTKNNVTKIGGGTAAGTIIGAMVGGGKGAAIGAGVGAGAGTATAAATGNKPATVEAEAVLLFVSAGPRQGQVLTSSAPPYADDPPPPVHEEYVHGRRREHDDDDDDDDDDHHEWRHHGEHHEHEGRPVRVEEVYYFGDRDREVLHRCLSRYDFDSLPPGIQKKLARGGSLPPGLARKQRALPASCDDRLPRLPHNVVRVIVGNRILVLEGGNHIVDMFIFERY